MSEKYVLATFNSNRFLKMLYCHCFSPVLYRYITAGIAQPVQWLSYRLLNHAIISWFMTVTRDLSLLQSIQTSSVVLAASYAVETGGVFRQGKEARALTSITPPYEFVVCTDTDENVARFVFWNKIKKSKLHHWRTADCIKGILYGMFHFSATRKPTVDITRCHM